MGRGAGRGRPSPPVGLGQGLTFPGLTSERKQALEDHMVIQNLTNQVEELVEREKERDEQILEMRDIIDTLKGRIVRMEFDVMEFGSKRFGETSGGDAGAAGMGTSHPRRDDKGVHIQGNTGADVVGRKYGSARHYKQKGEHWDSDDDYYYDENNYDEQEKWDLLIAERLEGRKEKKSGKRVTSSLGGGARGEVAEQTSGQKGLDMKKVCGGRVEKKGLKKGRGK